MQKKLFLFMLLLFSLFTLAGCGGYANNDGRIILTNVSYDPTREFYEEYNQVFASYWLEKTGQTVEVLQSHGGSGSQALSVANGLPADIVTLALEADIQSVADSGLIDEGWIDEFPLDSAPYTSTIVFLVRKGNPCSIQDWGDLSRDNIGVITPNPKTSGAARWIFLAAWAWGENQFDNDQQKTMEFMTELYHNVLVLDTGARGSTTTFCENQQGDVLLAWENEAILVLSQYPDQYEIISPSISMLCQPTVAVVDKFAAINDNTEVAIAYLEQLYTEEAQRMIGEHNYRPTDPDILAEFSHKFDLDMEMITIDHFQGWTEAQKKYFADGGLFDRIYE